MGKYCTRGKQIWTALNKRLNSRLLYLLSVEVNKVLSLQFCWYCDINGMEGKKNYTHPKYYRCHNKAEQANMKVTLLFSLQSHFNFFPL